MTRKFIIIFGCASVVTVFAVLKIMQPPLAENLAGDSGVKPQPEPDTVNNTNKVYPDSQVHPVAVPKQQVKNESTIASSTRPAAPGPVVRDKNLEVTLRNLARNVEVSNAADLRRMLLVAQKFEGKDFASFVADRLKATNLTLNERHNVIWLATKQNSPLLVPVWQGLLDRTLPAFPGEATDWPIWTLDHRNEQLHLVQTEQLRAIGGLGALQADSQESADFLLNFAVNRIPAPGDLTMLRTEATRQIHQFNRTGLLRVATLLGASDPLREQLAVLAKVRRGQYETP